MGNGKPFFPPAMKKIYRIILAAAFFVFSAGAATANGKDYTALAKGISFESIFPAHSNIYIFADLDEAYDFVNIAHAKFTQSSGKKRAQGLSAKLIGPPVIADKPVTAGYILAASKNNKPVDLSKIDGSLEKVIKDATSAVIIFLVFYGDRGVSISNYHLPSGYRYDSNWQVPYFNYNNTRYETKYPFGWGTDKAFSYLRKEID
jgi:hypothetical protein